ncbi:hydrogenase accessory protein HypB [Frankia sp. B2]|uniref:hydrogenase nickel incorporation protein HypB n=1 Tax=unclassified Frankia TaxID=2632575 RepID=UPI000461C9E4|nr:MULTISPECIES: hydrogenase nickel incorporation protein HypB [unclassified Frankia]KDA41673.1 Ni2+-binding GTPase, urease/hydrogenase maturation protein [Frankia sp. BMG5.23]KEZ35257.1 hydrogenase accessory protein HypB [Frankia sp. CeD]TFE27607.1 hydrogenase accessory protein HypB [Frankia sp. B2]
MGRFHPHPEGAHPHPEGAPHEYSGPHPPAGVSVGDHAGYGTGPERVEVLERILGENERVALANRAAFDAAGVTVVNLMSAPGAGKTTLLVGTLRRLGPQLRVGIIEGDIETSIDADRLDGLGAAIALINTGNGFGGECHLDAPMVASALGRLPLRDLDLVVIENVGNLVCPAEFEVGEDLRAMVFAVTEGEEKPLKYPVMFRSADLVLVNKTDLLPHLDFDLDAFRKNLADVNPDVAVLEVSARTGQGVDAWCAWLRALPGQRPEPTIGGAALDDDGDPARAGARRRAPGRRRSRRP